MATSCSQKWKNLMDTRICRNKFCILYNFCIKIVSWKYYTYFSIKLRSKLIILRSKNHQIWPFFEGGGSDITRANYLFSARSNFENVEKTSKKLTMCHHCRVRLYYYHFDWLFQPLHCIYVYAFWDRVSYCYNHLIRKKYYKNRWKNSLCGSATRKLATGQKEIEAYRKWRIKFENFNFV